MEADVKIRGWKLVADFELTREGIGEITLWTCNKGKWTEARWLANQLTKEEWDQVLDQIRALSLE